MVPAFEKAVDPLVFAVFPGFFEPRWGMGPCLAWGPAFRCQRVFLAAVLLGSHLFLNVSLAGVATVCSLFVLGVLADLNPVSHNENRAEHLSSTRQTGAFIPGGMGYFWRRPSGPV